MRVRTIQYIQCESIYCIKQFVVQYRSTLHPKTTVQPQSPLVTVVKRQTKFACEPPKPQTHTPIASWRSVSAEAHIRLNGPVTMQQLPPFYQKRFHVSGPQDGGAGTCLNPISFQRTSHHFFLLRLHLMMFARRIAVFRVMGWEAELDYSFLLDLRRRQSRVDGVIFGGANTAASAGSPKTSASLPGESCTMVTAAAGRGFKCPSVRSGAEMHRVTEHRHSAAEKGAFGFSCFDCTR